MCVKCGIRRFRALPTSGCCRGASRGAGHRPPQSSTTSHPGAFATLGHTSGNRPARAQRALLALLKFVAGWSAEMRPIWVRRAAAAFLPSTHQRKHWRRSLAPRGCKWRVLLRVAAPVQILLRISTSYLLGRSHAGPATEFSSCDWRFAFEVSWREPGARLAELSNVLPGRAGDLPWLLGDKVS
jgi:hypothetical protein